MNTEKPATTPRAVPTAAAKPPRTFGDWFPSAVGWGTALAVVLLIGWPRPGGPMSDTMFRFGWPVPFSAEMGFQYVGSDYQLSSGFSVVALLLDLASLPAMCTITVIGARVAVCRQISIKQMLLLTAAIAVMLGIVVVGPQVQAQVETFYSPALFPGRTGW